MIQQTSLIVEKKMSKAQMTFAFISTVIYGLLAVLFYQLGHYGTLAIFSILYVEAGFVFFVARNDVVLKLPDTPTYNLYRLGEKLFVGSTLDEAALFAEITKSPQPVLEQENVYFFDR